MDLAKQNASAMSLMTDICEGAGDTMIDFYHVMERRARHASDAFLMLGTVEAFQKRMVNFKKFERKIREAIEGANGDEDSTLPDCVADRVYRFVCRSHRILTHFLDALEKHILACLPGGHAQRWIQRDLMRLKSMSMNFWNTLPKPDSQICRHASGCTATDHFHTFDGLVWPKEERHDEREMSIPSLPEIAFGTFKFNTLPDAVLYSSFFDSLTHAITKSCSKQLSLSAPQFYPDKSMFEDTIRELDSPRDLVLTVRLQCKGYEYTYVGQRFRIGILLHGGSEVFWPTGEPTQSEMSKVVIINAIERKVKGKRCFRFQPLEVIQRSSDGTATQAVHFVDLPAEIRNMIYLKVLAGDDSHKKLGYQPVIALTCQLVNEEFMPLYFQHHGWVIRS